MSKDIKKKILDAIAHVRALGFTLVSEDWGDPAHKCACAMGCVLLKDDPTDLKRLTGNNTHASALILGVEEAWVDAFTEGFDGNGTAKESKLPEAWKVGHEVAKETKPIAYHLWDGENDG